MHQVKTMAEPPPHLPSPRSPENTEPPSPAPSQLPRNYHYPPLPTPTPTVLRRRRRRCNRLLLPHDRRSLPPAPSGAAPATQPRGAGAPAGGSASPMFNNDGSGGAAGDAGGCAGAREGGRGYRVIVDRAQMVISSSLAPPPESMTRTQSSQLMVMVGDLEKGKGAAVAGIAFVVMTGRRRRGGVGPWSWSRRPLPAVEARRASGPSGA